MSWDYRVVRHYYLGAEDAVKTYLTIHEVYYEDDGVTPRAYSEEPTELAIDVEHDEDTAIRIMDETITKMREAFTKPIIDEEDL